MAVSLQPIASFRCGSNPAESWAQWRQSFLYYLTALKYHKEDADIQIALFLQVCGPDINQIYQTFSLSSPVTLDSVLDAFDEHFAPFKNLTMASFIFHRISQDPGQSFDQFLTALKLQARECEFGAAEDRILKDRIIQGIRDQPLQERLLREGTISLKKVIEQCKAAEISKLHSSFLSQPSIGLDAHSLAMDSLAIRHQQKARQNHQRLSDRASSRVTFASSSSKQKPCSRCGTIHEKRKCPAHGSICNKCGKQNHWAKMCRSLSQNTKQSLHTVTGTYVEANPSEEKETVFLGELLVSCLSNFPSEWLQTIVVHGTRIEFKLDTGAQVNIISKNTYESLIRAPKLVPTNIKVSTYTGQRVNILGAVTLHCAFRETKHSLEFLVTDLDAQSILGLHACQLFDLIIRPQAQVSVTLKDPIPVDDTKTTSSVANFSETPEKILKEFSDVFQGQGTLPGEYHIVLKDSIEPHVAAPRRIPAALEDKVRTELQSMVNSGIIVKVDEPSDWVNSMVVVQQKNGIRICLDPRPLNKAIKRPHYPIPTPETLFAKLKGTKVFSVFDATHGFWHLKLDDESSKLTTFITPLGRYRFTVLPFGLSCAPEAFQSAMDRIFESENDINPYLDDVLLGSDNVTEHCILLRKMLTIARRNGLKLNSRKLQLALPQVHFLGHLITSEGVSASPTKISAIQDFPPPTNKQELLRFLGMATYLMKFVPSFSQHTFQLRLLLKKDTVWVWDSNTQKQFENIKLMLQNPPVLRFFDNNKPVTVSVDASSYGIGAVLMQENQPIMYASVSLSSTERMYSQIEKELLAAVYALDRFHYYVFGRVVELQTDHKPLLGLSTKPYHTVTPRLQRLLMRLQRYDVTFKFVPGKQLVVPDALSRAPTANIMPNTVDPDISATACLLVQASPVKLQEIREATEKDETLQEVLRLLKSGWPSKRSKVSPLVVPYCTLKDELHCIDGLLCRGNRLVIPTSLRKSVLEVLHSSHRGIVSTKARARETLYWPGMTQHIEEYIANCAICQEHQPQQQREPLIDNKLPSVPWQKVAMDFFYHQQVTYFLIVDYYSKFIEVVEMTTTTASQVIKVLKSVFARFGVPEEVISDNGSPFQSSQLSDFFRSWNIQHTTSSPLFSQSNGLAERAVQTIKAALRKTLQGGGDIFQVLLDYRSTPIDGLSPAERLMGRKIRTLLPVLPKLLKPMYPHREIKDSLQIRQKDQHRYADRNSKSLPPLKVDQSVWYWTGTSWKRGKISQCGPHPRSYLIVTDNGNTYRRNRIHIRPNTSLPVPIRTAEDYVDTCKDIEPEKRVCVPTSGSISRYGRIIRPPRRFPN